MEWERIEKESTKKAIECALRNLAFVETNHVSNELEEIILHADGDTIRISCEYSGLKVHQIKPPETYPGIGFSLSYKGKRMLVEPGLLKTKEVAAYEFRERLEASLCEKCEPLNLDYTTKQHLIDAVREFEWFNNNPEKHTREFVEGDWTLSISYFRAEEDVCATKKKHEPRF